MAFPFEGQLLFAVAGHYHYNIYIISTCGVLVHLLGIIFSGYLFRSARAVKKLFQYTILLNITACFVFLYPPSALWYAFLFLGLFFSGCCAAAWAIYMKDYTPVDDRMVTIADFLIINNSILLLIGVVTMFITYQMGLLFMILLLTTALFFSVFLPEEEGSAGTAAVQGQVNIKKVFLLLTVFLFLGASTIGLTFQFILPAYYKLGKVTYFYWTVAYIIALIIMRKFFRKINRNFMLTISVAFLGFAFVDFMLFGITWTGFYLSCTQIFFARAVFDLLWWSISGELLEFCKAPVKLYGGILFVYLLGQVTGGNLGFFARHYQVGLTYPVAAALVAVLTMTILLPPLKKELSSLLKSHSFLSRLSELEPVEQAELVKKAALFENLTERESEIVALLMQGRTYKMISAELFLSENTIKTHIKNIYSKLQVKNKAELINTLLEHQKE